MKERGSRDNFQLHSISCDMIRKLVVSFVVLTVLSGTGFAEASYNPGTHSNKCHTLINEKCIPPNKYMYG